MSHSRRRTAVAVQVVERDFSEFRKLLVEKRDEKLENVNKGRAQIRQDSIEQGTQSNGQGDVADVCDHHVRIRLTELDRAEVVAIENALMRIEKGTYGNCFECGDPISDARLRSLPQAVNCVDCKEAKERSAQRDRFNRTIK